MTSLPLWHRKERALAWVMALNRELASTADSLKAVSLLVTP
jgi:hypothetical protein